MYGLLTSTLTVSRIVRDNLLVRCIASLGLEVSPCMKSTAEKTI